MEEKKPKPRVDSQGQKELDKAKTQIDNFENSVKEMTMDRMNMAPKEEVEPQTKLSDKQLDKIPDFYLKPKRSLPDRMKFNENYRKDWEFQKEYVEFIAEHKELIGENIELWTHPRGGIPAEYWEVPTNKPVWGPRYLADQIKSKGYHRLVMKQNTTASDGMGQYYGVMAADTFIQRLDAIPVSKRRSVFMGASGF